MNKKHAVNRVPAKRRTPADRRRHQSTAPKAKRFVRSTAPRVRPDDVVFVHGQTASIRGGKRLFWHIECGGGRAGHVSIDCFEKDGNTTDTSIDVQLNQWSRGRGIGTVAFRRACEMSGLKEVLASIRKGNVASKIAAERAGFVPLQDQPSGEMLMIWRRP